MNIIEFYQKQGFKISSDPNKYSSGIWGKRDYTVNGYNYDSYCNGYHRAYDLYNYHGCPIVAFTDCVIEYGTRPYGTFGGQVVISFKDKKGKKWLMIYGHVNRDFTWKIGTKVKKGTILCYQSNTHNQGANVSMDSHLHIQVMSYGSYGEWAFTCTGVEIKNIEVDIDGKSNTKVKPSKHVKSKWKKNKHGTWYMVENGTFTVGSSPIVARDRSPKLSAKSNGMVKSGTEIHYDEICLADGYVWIGYTLFSGKREYLPIRTWNGIPPTNQGVGNLWGRIKLK